MNIIPRFQQGGGFDSLFTEYKPIQTETPKQQTTAKASKKSAKDDEDDDNKGKLTERDFFMLLKDVDGLPNEMGSLLTGLINTFQTSNLTGQNVNNIATMYLSNLYQLKIIKGNRMKYDEAVKNAQINGSMYEPAISTSGNLIVQTEDGNITEVDLKTYFDNRENYKPLNVSNVARLRAFDDEFINNQSAFDIINNSMGFEAFQKLVDSAKTTLGSSSVTKNGYIPVEGDGQEALKILRQLSRDDRVQAMKSITLEGLYEYKIIDKNQYQQIKYLTSYILSTLPENAKTWAAWKLQTPNKNKATQSLILQYLLSTQTTDHQFNIVAPDEEKVSSSKSGSGSKGSNGEDPKAGFWAQVQVGTGGSDSDLVWKVDNGNMSVSGKYYGTTPGLESNCSLQEYIAKSGVGYMRSNDGKITFGDILLSNDSYKDVMIDANAGAYIVTLPVKNGEVWLEASDLYSKFEKELNQAHLKGGTNEFYQKIRELLQKPEYIMLQPLLMNNGQLDPNHSSQFLVLEGLASSGTSGIISKGQEIPTKFYFDNIESKYVDNLGEDDDLTKQLKYALSIKNKDGKLEEYEIPGGWLANENIYKGLIYIPLSYNKIDAMNADDNDIKYSTVYGYERSQQYFDKINNEGDTYEDKL